MKIPKKVQASVETQIEQLKQATEEGTGKYKYLSCEFAYQLLDAFYQFENKIDAVEENDQFINRRDWKYIIDTLYGEKADGMYYSQSIDKFLEQVGEEYELYQ